MLKEKHFSSVLSLVLFDESERKRCVLVVVILCLCLYMCFCLCVCVRSFVCVYVVSYDVDSSL